MRIPRRYRVDVLPDESGGFGYIVRFRGEKGRGSVIATGTADSRSGARKSAWRDLEAVGLVIDDE